MFETFLLNPISYGNINFLYMIHDTLSKRIYYKLNIIIFITQYKSLSPGLMCIFLKSWNQMFILLNSSLPK